MSALGTVRLPRDLWERLGGLTREVGAHSVRELVEATLGVLAEDGEVGAALRAEVRARLAARGTEGVSTNSTGGRRIGRGRF